MTAAYDTAKAMNDFKSLDDKIDDVLKDDGRTSGQKKEHQAIVESVRAALGDEKAEALANDFAGQSEESLQAKREAIAQAIINIAGKHNITLAAGKASKAPAATTTRKPRSSTPFDPTPFIAKVQNAMKQMKKGQEYKKSEVLELAGISNDELTAMQWGEVGRPAGLVKLGTAGAGTRWGIK